MLLLSEQAYQLVADTCVRTLSGCKFTSDMDKVGAHSPVTRKTLDMVVFRLRESY